MRACCAAAARSHAGSKRPVGNVKRLCQVLFQFCKTISFAPCIAARHRHVALGPRGAPQRAIFAAQVWRALLRISRELIRAAYGDLKTALLWPGFGTWKRRRD